MGWGNAGQGGPPPERLETDLLVYCDVSASLSKQMVEQEPAIIFRFIRNDVLFRSGHFAIHIADRDVETEPAVYGTKPPVDFLDEKLKRDAELKQKENQLSQALKEYEKSHSARTRTCLVKAIRSAPRLFAETSNSKHRRLVIVSDMLEDCYAQGDPRTPDQLRARIARSLKDYPLAPLSGAPVTAVFISSAAEPMDLDVLRTVWTNTLEPAKAKFSIATIDTLVHNAAMAESQGK